LVGDDAAKVVGVVGYEEGGELRLFPRFCKTLGRDAPAEHLAEGRPFDFVGRKVAWVLDEILRNRRHLDVVWSYLAAKRLGQGDDRAASRAVGSVRAAIGIDPAGTGAGALSVLLEEPCDCVVHDQRLHDAVRAD